MEKRVLVTGANGFIGQNCLMPLLQEGYTVYACCHHLPATKISNINYIECDLTDKQNVEKILKSISATCLLHLAWYVEPGKYMHSEENIRWLSCSLRLIRLFVKYGGQRVVTAGTCAEYDWKKIPDNGNITENFSVQGDSSLYSTAKLALANITSVYMKECGLSAAHGRIFYLFGPGENVNRLIPSTIFSLKNKQVMELRNGFYIRDYLYVKDVANAFIKILDSNVEGPVNIGYGEGQTLYNLLEGVESIMGTKGLIKMNNIINKSEPMSIVADIDKLRKLGWTRKYSLEEGLREYCKLISGM